MMTSVNQFNSLNDLNAAYACAINNNPRQPNVNNQVRLNSKLATTWVDSHQSDCQSALRKLVDSVQRITYDQFLTQLRDSTTKFAATLESQERYVILVEPNKSNQWVAELALHKLGILSGKEPEKILRLGEKDAKEFRVYLDKLETLYDTKRASLSDFPTRVVLFDDGSYSGQQLSEHVQNILNATKDIRARKGIKPLRVDVVVPYATNHAKNLLSKQAEKYKQFHLFTSAIIPSVSEKLTQEEGKTLQKLYGWDDKGTQSRGVIYFDHKIPNEKSFVEPLVKGSVYCPKPSKEDESTGTGKSKNTQQARGNAKTSKNEKKTKENTQPLNKQKTTGQTHSAKSEERPAPIPPVLGIIPDITPPYKS